MATLAYILLACFLGTLLSIGLAALVAFRVQAHWIPTLVSFAVGALLGAAFLDLLPHLFEQTKNPGRTAAFILLGILAFFVLEKLLLWRHHHHHSAQEDAEAIAEMERTGHDHGRSGWMIIFGDSFHNFTDGVIIAGAFLASTRLGVVTSLAIIAHEIPQEIGDFLVLLHSGFGRRRAMFWNVLSGMAALLGALLAYFALSAVSDWIPEILAFAAASMIYVAVADLIPGLHKRTALHESFTQVAFIALGIASIWVIHALLFPEH
ncbi:MAG TPA: ZIP family metal transporter [Usitatibacter sp.]|nr:ZIP family metal transporter [Usitatibacter sp.]